MKYTRYVPSTIKPEYTNTIYILNVGQFGSACILLYTRTHIHNSIITQTVIYK